VNGLCNVTRPELGRRAGITHASTLLAVGAIGSAAMPFYICSPTR